MDSTLKNDKVCVLSGCNNLRWHSRSEKCKDHRFSCVIPGCRSTTARPGLNPWGQPRSNGAYCQLHRNRITKWGDPYYVKEADWYKHASGYIYRRKQKDGKTLSTEWQHRVVMEEFLGRSLQPGENVHHINGVRDDNRLENLELWSTYQPSGQRVLDKLDWAREIVALYGPDEEQLRSLERSYGSPET